MKASLTINQEEALEKLSRLKVGALFMEMGTGKTRVALDLIAGKRKKVDYVLWICPFSLKSEIEAEKAKWHPELDIHVVGCESIGSSDRIYLEVLEKVKNNKSFIVVDESLKIKNRHAKRTERIIQMGHEAQYKLILNGTPISKNYCDLWSQMEFLSPKILDMSFNQFYNTYCEYYLRGKLKGKIRRFVNIPHLVDKISPYIFDAELDINTHKNYYTYTYSVDREAYDEYKMEVFDEYYDHIRDDLNFNAFTMKLQRWYLANSNRQEIVDEIIEDIDDRVIVFVRFLDSIPEGATSLIGAKTEAERNQIISDFKAGKIKVLYITYGCGAYGLNLQCCQNMIFADHTWDYALRDQAEARIYRIGQVDTVNYYDVTCGNVNLEKLIERCVSYKSSMLDTIKAEIQKLKGGTKEWVKGI